MSQMLPDNLKQLRKDNGLSQTQVAEILGIDYSRYGKWELGKSTPGLDLLIKIADYYGVTTDYLLGRTDDPTPPNSQKKESPEKREPLPGITEEELDDFNDFEERMRAIVIDELKKKGIS